MENKAYFGSLTDRMKAFREEVLDEKPYMATEPVCTLPMAAHSR